MRGSSRDNQRSRVYAWEAAIKGYHRAPTWTDIEDVKAFMVPIWKSERGRYGRAKVPPPQVLPGGWGQRSAIAYDDHRVSFPKWARHPCIVLHEMAHRLTPRDEAHGPRFVGVLIGLMSRHAGYDAYELMAKADEMGVKYHVKSIGSVPVRGTVWHLCKTVREETPMTEMELAVWLDLSYMQVRGAAMNLIRHGKARWLRGKLVPIEEAKSVEIVKPARKKTPGLYELARANSIDIDKASGSVYFVYPGDWLGDEDDPHQGDHACDDLKEVWAMVREYISLKEQMTTLQN